MKTLLMVRHAKSSWETPEIDDLNRPIIENGINKTKKVIEYLKEKNILPDIIVSSHATRALQTARLFAEGLSYTKEIEVNKNIYEADEKSISDEVYALPNNASVVMIIGHNPTITQLANVYLVRKSNFLPTSSVVSITFETDFWGEIDRSSKKVNFTALPKKLKQI